MCIVRAMRVTTTVSDDLRMVNAANAHEFTSHAIVFT
jgi:hypothetical protein